MSNITFLYGEKTIVLKPPIIRTVVTKRKFWFDKVEYYVDWEYCSLGPFKNYDDAYTNYALGLKYAT